MASAPAAEEANTCNESEPKMPPGFAPPESHHHEQLPSLPPEEELHSATIMAGEDMPPCFGIPHGSAVGASASPGINIDGDVADAPLVSGVCDDDDDL